MPKTINITWTQPTIGSPINDYTIEYGVSGQALTNINTGSSSPSYQIDDLTDNEIYQLRIAGINAEGTGDYAPVVYHYASQYPSAPLALASGEPVNSGDVLLTWNTPEFSETNIVDYDISYTPDGGSTTNINTTNTSYDITNLDCSKNVNVSIKASNASGEGPEIVADFVPFCGASLPSSFNIILEDDGTSGFDLQADISMDDLPAGATGYKIAFEGQLGEGAGTPFTGALLYIQSPSVGPIYSTNDGPPSTGGTATDTFRAFWRSGTIPPTSGYNRDTVFITTQSGSEFDGTVTIQPVDASNNPVGSNSNTISVFIFEDG